MSRSGCQQADYLPGVSAVGLLGVQLLGSNASGNISTHDNSTTLFVLECHWQQHHETRQHGAVMLAQFCRHVQQPLSSASCS